MNDVSKIGMQLALARQNEKERRESDDVLRRSDDSYSPRRIGAR
jgi:hypothetical protein